MALQSIVNAAPLHLIFGTEDVSTRALQLQPLDTPSHLPKFYLWTKRGPTTAQLSVGDSRTQIYGDDSFTIGSKWFNHATLYANEVNAQGNSQMIQRLIPDDAGPVANLLLSLELVVDMIDDYERNSDGSYALDPTTNLPIALPTKILGYRGAWRVSSITDVANVPQLGNATQGPGTMTGVDDTSAPTTSIIYPIMELRASSIGSDGNNTAVRIWAPDINSSTAFDSRILSQGKIYPFRMSVIRRADSDSTGKPVTNIAGEQNVLVTFKPNGVNPITGANFDVASNFIEAYQNVNDPTFPTQLGDFGKITIYQNNVNEILGKIYKNESDYLAANISASGDITLGETNGQYKINLFSAANYDSSKYHTFVLESDNVVVISEFTQQYCNGGDDGTMDDTSFDLMVRDAIQEYADPNSRLQSMALNVENTFYDSGFTRETKLKLTSFIAERKDTFLWLATYEHNATRLAASEESSLAIGLRTQAQLYPESDYYGTPVMRCAIMGRVGKYRGSLWTYDVSPLIEVAGKMAWYLGRGDGVWRAGGNFSSAPGSVLTKIYDINENYTPAIQRNRDWENGLNWVEAFDMQSNSIPALKTVYNNDTSVLTSVLTVYAICNLERIADEAWRQFRGVDNLTRPQLAERVENFIYARVNNKFDSRYVIVPEVFFTDADIARGYSWQLRNNIYANNMMTVQTSHIRAHRMDELTTSTSS